MWQKYAFGWISNITTITYKIPQIYKIYKVKSVESISLFSLCIQVFGYIFYILHGYFNDDTTRVRGVEPQQNPLNQWRRTGVCSSETNVCKTNEKVKVDSFAQNFGKDTCYYPYIRNIINKDGVRKNDFIFSSRK